MYISKQLDVDISSLKPVVIYISCSCTQEVSSISWIFPTVWHWLTNW